MRSQTELLRLARINFSEAFQALVHLKLIRLFVESVLRYGLPANYTGIILKVRLAPDLTYSELTDLASARSERLKEGAVRALGAVRLPCATLKQVDQGQGREP
jgi:hypothetical protein